MSYFSSVLYSLLFVAEIYASWIKLTAPEFSNETGNLSNEGTNTIAQIPHEISTQKTQLMSVTTNFIPFNPKNNITFDLHEPKNTINKSHRSSNDVDSRSPTFIDKIPTTDKIGLHTTNDGIQNEIVTGEPVFQNSTIHGNKKLLDLIDGLADKVVTNTQKEAENLIYSSHITYVSENVTSIIWQEDRIKGPEVTLLANALPPNSAVKIILFREKHQSKFLGDIVVVKTQSIEEYPFRRVLQIKFEKKYIFYSHGKWKCAYWDYEDSLWRDTGITTKQESDFIICLSTHFSAFSILLDPYNILYDKENWHNSEHEFWLTSISVIGSWITIFFIILVIIIHHHKKSENETSKILINSSFALLLTHASYQIYTFLDQYCTCLVINFMTHYFVLAFLLWTAADGINMWRILFTSIFNTNGYVFYKWYKIICWGVPIITTSIGLYFSESHSHGKCKLRFHKTYDLIFYLIPCMLIFCCNMLLFTYMFVKMTCKNRLGRLKDKKINFVLALTQVFGIGWCVVFPFLCFPSTHLLGEYLFAAVVSTQGILIFVVRCCGDKNLRRKLQNGFQSKLNSSSVSTWFQKMSKSSTDRTSPTSQKSMAKQLGIRTRCNSLTSQF